MDKYRAYVGSYTRGESKGIYMYDFNQKRQSLWRRGLRKLRILPF